MWHNKLEQIRVAKAERFGNRLETAPKYAHGQGIEPVNAAVELLGGHQIVDKPQCVAEERCSDFMPWFFCNTCNTIKTSGSHRSLGCFWWFSWISNFENWCLVPPQAGDQALTPCNHSLSALWEKLRLTSHCCSFHDHSSQNISVGLWSVVVAT